MTLAEQARRTVTDIRAARLEREHWGEVRLALDDLAIAAAAREEPGVRAALLILSRAAFASKVRRQMPSGSAAAGIVPTKRSGGLPVVGAVCGGLVLAMGWYIGGGVVLAASAAFAVFILVVAVAGSMVIHDRQRPEGTVDPTVPAPPEVVGAADLALVAIAGGYGVS